MKFIIIMLGGIFPLCVILHEQVGILDQQRNAQPQLLQLHRRQTAAEYSSPTAMWDT